MARLRRRGPRAPAAPEAGLCNPNSRISGGRRHSPDPLPAAGPGRRKLQRPRRQPGCFQDRQHRAATSSPCVPIAVGYPNIRSATRTLPATPPTPAPALRSPRPPEIRLTAGTEAVRDKLADRQSIISWLRSFSQEIHIWDPTDLPDRCPRPVPQPERGRPLQIGRGSRARGGRMSRTALGVRWVRLRARDPELANVARTEPMGPRPRPAHYSLRLSEARTRTDRCPRCGAEAIVSVWATFHRDDSRSNELTTVRSCSADARHRAPLYGWIQGVRPVETADSDASSTESVSR